jgi:hypothetical protein
MSENKPIVRVLFAKIKAAFYELSDEEQMEFMVKDRRNWEEFGCKVFMLIGCCWSTS